MTKWTLRSPMELLVGTLVYAEIYPWDGDHNVFIVPDTAYESLLTNRHGKKNKPDESIHGSPTVVECEVEILDRYEHDYLAAVRSLYGLQVSALGVWVDDDGHDGKTELHPLDTLWGLVPQDRWPQWITEFLAIFKTKATNHESLDSPPVSIYRVVAGSDDSFLNHPLLADETRAVTLTFPFPPSPGPGWTPAWLPKFTVRHAVSFVDMTADLGTTAALVLKVEAKSYRDGGPGALVGDVVTYWKPPQS